tara:strand:- start:1376 stop:2446 length:1071 start_codon:yes stop_codon:yes gene_type:complete
MKKIIHIVGTRPNYVKAAPVINALKEDIQTVVNTGQHYDKILSSDIMKSLDMKEPDVNLSVPKGLNSFSRLSFLITSLAELFASQRPEIVVVYGDVDSTLAASLAASRLNIPIAHVESGLRSFDNEMPEEVNRKIVDQISSLHFVTEESGYRNLVREGHRGSILFVGNSMIDSLVSIRNSESFKKSSAVNMCDILLTCHRPSNVDNKESLNNILNMCKDLEQTISWPIHPRTINNINKFGLLEEFKSLSNLKILSPLNYCDFIKMMSTSKAVITDSGGIQEETTFLNIPCLTVRKNTERPSTIESGSNVLVDFREAKGQIRKIERNEYKNSQIPTLWDGNAGPRIAKHILKFLKEL